MTMAMTGTKRLWGRAAAFGLLAALLAIALAACGGNTAPGIASADGGQGTAPANTNPTPTPVDEMDAALAYAQCIRDNGFPEWPDPDAQGRIMVTRDMGSFDDPRRLAAMEACQHLRPAGIAGPGGTGGRDQETLLAFAQCMRENGVPDFPDPVAGGGGIVINPGGGGGGGAATGGPGAVMGPGGINANDPNFQGAMQACNAILSGAAQ